jgi:hypothetical protein
MSNTKVVLQINSIEALERILNGSEGLELQIKENIVQEFTKRYLKGIANEEIVKQASHKIKEEIEETLFGDSNKYSFRLKELKPEYIKLIEETIEHKIKLELLTMICDRIDINTQYQKIDELITERINILTNGITEQDVLDRVDEFLRKKLEFSFAVDRYSKK